MPAAAIGNGAGASVYRITLLPARPAKSTTRSQRSAGAVNRFGRPLVSIAGLNGCAAGTVTGFGRNPPSAPMTRKLGPGRFSGTPLLLYVIPSLLASAT